jgi:iron(III) transport system substrate-binding protein
MDSFNRWSIAAAIATALAVPALAQETTPAMVAAAEKEGKVVWYNSVDVKVAEAIKKAFNETYPKIDVEVERTGSERVLQRVNQEMSAGIRNVDIVNSSDASHFLFWKQQKWLVAHTPPDAAKFEARYRDADNMYFTWRASLCSMGYNTNLVKDSDAPKSYADLLDPKWKGKMVKAHPGYSGTALTGTFAITKVLGWDYLAKLSKQNVLQQQSTTATPKSLASGERAVMIDGNEYNMFIEIDKKSPVKIIYPTEGTPFVNSPSAIFAGAPHPNAARVFENFIFTPAAQQLLVNEGGLRSLVAGVKEPANRTPLKDIKLLPDDPEAMLPQVAEIKKKYTALFGN